LKDRPSEDRGEDVGGASDAEQHECGPQPRTEAEERDRDTPACNRPHHRAALVGNVSDPASHECPGQCANARCRVQQSDGTGTTVKTPETECREECPRHAERHRDEVAKEDALQWLMSFEVAEPSEHRLEAELSRCVPNDGRRSTHPQHGDE